METVITFVHVFALALIIHDIYVYRMQLLSKIRCFMKKIHFTDPAQQMPLEAIGRPASSEARTDTDT